MRLYSLEYVQRGNQNVNNTKRGARKMKFKCRNNHVFTDEGIDKHGKKLPKLTSFELCPICGEKMDNITDSVKGSLEEI